MSRNCRTSSVPWRADDRQWTWRRSSPGTYSRSAWKARSDIDTFSDVLPSRSRTMPGAERVEVGDARVHEDLDGFGPRDVAAEQAERVSPDAGDRADLDDSALLRRHDEQLGCPTAGSRARAGRSRSRQSPTGSSSTTGRSGAFERLVTSTAPETGSPTVTRGGLGLELDRQVGAPDEEERRGDQEEGATRRRRRPSPPSPGARPGPTRGRLAPGRRDRRASPWPSPAADAAGDTGDTQGVTLWRRRPAPRATAARRAAVTRLEVDPPPRPLAPSGARRPRAAAR